MLTDSGYKMASGNSQTLLGRGWTKRSYWFCPSAAGSPSSQSSLDGVVRLHSLSNYWLSIHAILCSLEYLFLILKTHFHHLKTETNKNTLPVPNNQIVLNKNQLADLAPFRSPAPPQGSHKSVVGRDPVPPLLRRLRGGFLLPDWPGWRPCFRRLGVLATPHHVTPRKHRWRAFDEIWRMFSFLFACGEGTGWSAPNCWTHWSRIFNPESKKTDSGDRRGLDHRRKRLTCVTPETQFPGEQAGQSYGPGSGRRLAGCATGPEVSSRSQLGQTPAVVTPPWPYLLVPLPSKVNW